VGHKCRIVLKNLINAREHTPACAESSAGRPRSTKQAAPLCFTFPHSPKRSGQARGEAESSLQTDLILDILGDIEANLRKIHEHGSRADGIVKSMLQHSRGGSGKMEPTDLNDLVKEYVNLAFHGMRAGKEPISVDIQLELDENVGEVPLIAEDISRVILNLCNNAFYAMREKLTADSRQLSTNPDPGYKPKLTARTQTKNSTIIIEIEDNGPGIPDEIKDKILQPFFTTKKGTEGTGLGLSISNDIVKAHGGELKVEALPAEAAAQAGKGGEGCMFSIVLPI
jgi:signal transduction histidine kinase